jgi:hypothetical protein
VVTARECVRCPRCDGSGRVPLARSLRETLEALRAYAEATPTGLVHDHRGVSVTALCNRLATLARLGFATVRAEGKQRWYRAKKGGHDDR